jgi:2-oxoglutarate ferredoxin oxidoreductase subunit alpha
MSVIGERCFDITVKAFNLAEKYRNPVIVLSDEVIAHMREIVVLPDPSTLQLIERKKPNVPPEWYKHFQITADFTSPMAVSDRDIGSTLPALPTMNADFRHPTARQ